MRKLVCVPAFFLFFAAVGTSAHAQLNIRRIKLTVKDTAGMGIPGVMIRITNPDMSRFKLEEKTNKKGGATVSLLAEVKRIHIALEKEGYQLLKTETAISPPLGTSNRVFVMYRIGELTPEQKQEAAERQHYADLHFRKGLELFEEGSLDACIKEFNRALEFRPDWLEAYQNLSAAYYRLEKYDKAIEYAEKSLEIDPNLSEAYRLLSVAYSRLGDEKTARMYEEKLRTMEGVEIPAEEYFNMGAVAANENHDEKALEHFMKAVEVKPEFADAHYQMALCYIRLGRREEAIPVLKKYLQLQPEGQEADNAKMLIKAFSKE